MTADMWLAIAILAVAIILFVTEWVRVDIVALGVILSLVLTDILTVDEAFAGFSNSAVLTIIFLFIVGGAVLQTGLASVIGRRILSIAGTDERRLILIIMLAVAFLSGFMSSTGTVAVLLPAIVSLSRTAKLSPSKLLIPLSFASLLGGATTLIGTPPNIIVADVLREANNALAPEAQYTEFGFFSFTPVGILLLITGVIFMVTIGRRILPNYMAEEEDEPVDPPQKLVDYYRLNEQMAYLRVERNSELNNKTLGEMRLRREFDVNVVEIIREPAPRTVAAFGGQKLVIQSDDSNYIVASANTRIEHEDILIVQGDASAVRRFAYTMHLSFEPAPEEGNQALINRQIGIAEVLLTPRSSLIGKTLAQIRFNQTYTLTVLRINQSDEQRIVDEQATTLEFGDTLLVQGLWSDIRALKKERRDFVVIGQSQPIGDSVEPIKAGITLAVLVAMVAMMITGIVPLAIASLLAALGVIITGCLSMDEAYDAIDWKSVVLIAGMLPMATALEKVDLVNEIATLATTTLGGSSDLVILGGLFMLTAILTQVLSNTATTVLLAPIALAMAQQLGVAPKAFLMVIAVSASMAFASPVASPTNTLVLSGGQYKFADFIKVGVPMLFFMMIVTVLAVPIFFPL
jgi:di/tricarboxylate transporter